MVQPEDPVYYPLLQAAYAKVKRPDTETVIKDVPTGIANPEDLNYLSKVFMNEREILKSFLQAEEQGFDAIASACYFDGGVRAAQQALNIPVAGASISAMHFAAQIGTRFAAITTEAAWTFQMERNIEEFGMGHFAIPVHPVRAISVPMDKFFGAMASGDYSVVVEDFTRVAKGCIADGADVIISGCGLMSPMLTLSGITEVDGVAVVDPMLSALKMAEMMVDYKRAGLPVKTRAGWLQS